MLEQYVRHYYQRHFVDHVATIIGNKFTPTQVTILGGLIGCLVPFAIYYQQLFLALSLLLISGFLDTLDGTIARMQHQVSDVGSLLDIFMDRVVEFAVIMGLWFCAPSERSLMCLMMLGSIFLCVTSFLTVGIFSNNQSAKSFHYSPGLIERPEAFIFFALMLIIPDYFFVLSLTFTVLVCVTTYLRIYEFVKKQ